VRFEADSDKWRMVALDPDNAPIQQIYNAQTTMGRI
jgi:probable phosphoglycerate mutase